MPVVNVSHLEGLDEERLQGRVGPMTDASRVESLERMLTQARHFAEREHYIDAIARLEHVLGQLTEDDVMLRARAEGELEDYRARGAAWDAGVAARRKATVDGAADEMARPLPLPPPGA